MASSSVSPRVTRAAFLRVLLNLILITMVLHMSAYASARVSSQVLVVGEPKNAFSGALDRFRVEHRTISELDETLDLNDFAAVVICARDRKNPQVIPHQVGARLQDYVRHGGRALIEFAAGNTFGVELGNRPVFARHERIVVSRRMAGVSDLPTGTLLDEQYSYVLPAKSIPENADRILDYGEFVGTYRVKPIATRFYEFWVDLGVETTISSATQRYGGKNPHYCPDSVELLTGTDPADMKPVGTYSGPWLDSQTAELSFQPREARYVLFRCSRDDSGPGEYWFFAGEIAVNSPEGVNVALRRKTRVLTPVYEEAWRAGKLTDGIIDGIYSDGHSIMLGAVGSDFGTAKWPALLSVPYGQGTALMLTTRLSDYADHHYRPSGKWDAAIRGICLELLPNNLRRRAGACCVPLSAHTEPRRWAQQGDKTRLVVRTSEAAKVSAECPGLTVGTFRQTRPGEWRAAVSGDPGDHIITVTARTRSGHATEPVKLLIADRRSAYDRAVKRSMTWFLESGIMPRRDGSAGVHSAVFVPNPDDGPQENLPGPIRTDNLAMVIDAFVRFADISGDQAWLDRARRLGDMLVGTQRLDLSKADCGSFPWILSADGKVVDSHIWFHDNESRVITGLLDLYAHTREPKYLESALRSLNLAMDVSREDYTIGNHSIAPDALNKMGRAGYRQLANYTLYHYDIMRWFWAYAATGDAGFHEAASTVARLYSRNNSSWIGSHAWAVGPYAIKLLGDSELSAIMDKHARGKLTNSDIARFGTGLTRGPGNYSLLYRNDCSINTDSEPLADLLYTAPMDLRRAWFAYKASGSRSALDLYTRLADFLVRIQLEDSSPKVDGCWVRGFDTDLWEDFGAPYDPNYGPYHAYSGWMNSMISEGLAFYVLDEDPFGLHSELWKQAQPLANESRKSSPPDRVACDNIALHKTCTLSPMPTSGESRVLTDGVIDGDVSDGQSVIWQMPTLGRVFTASVTVDLGRPENVAMIGARMGGLNPDYNSDSVSIAVGMSLEEMKPVAVVQAGPTVTWSVWKQFEPVRGRYVRLAYAKTRFKASQDKLAVGEITVLAYSTGQ